MSPVRISMVVAFLACIGTLAPGQPLAMEQARGEHVVEQLHLAELMGPLAPIALSPYFGLTCLSGAAILSGRGVLPENEFLTANPVLGRPGVFAALLALSVLTSLPRLTKVSKSLVQLIDPLETYSGIVAYLVIVLVAHGGAGGDGVAAGIVGTSLDGALYLAMVLNLVVVNTVRFFFETLILLSPIPAIDALFEAANKAVVAGLMALYALSPHLAFVLNIAILLVCLALFRRMHRRTVYFRHVLFGLFIKARQAGDAAQGLSVFPRRAGAAGKPFQHARLHRDRAGWAVHVRGRSVPLPSPRRIAPGLLTHTLHAGEAAFAITRRQDPALPQIAAELDAELAATGLSLGSVRSLFGVENRRRLKDA